MPTSVTITRPEGPLRGSITLPPGKSVANRALILAALAGQLAGVKGYGAADDTRILHRLLEQRPHCMHCGDGGTTLRFLLAWACVQPGEEHLITGSPRLLERPHGMLVEALRTLGADITPTVGGFRVRGRNMAGGAITLDSPPSSQFISALLLIAPCFAKGLTVHWTGLRLSGPYVQMTLQLLERYGAHAWADANIIHVAPGGVRTTTFLVPADWSAASFWYQLAALAPDATLRLNALSADGLQGDEAVAGLFREHVATTPMDGAIEIRSLGARPAKPFAADLQGTPDLFQPLAFTMAALGRDAVLTGLQNLPLKETDRLKAVAGALHVLGCSAAHEAGHFRLSGPVTNRTPPPFDPHGDHRMAMSLAPLALVCGETTIVHPEVVNKSYPGYWGDLERVGFLVRRA